LQTGRLLTEQEIQEIKQTTIRDVVVRTTGGDILKKIDLQKDLFRWKEGNIHFVTLEMAILWSNQSRCFAPEILYIRIQRYEHIAFQHSYVFAEADGRPCHQPYQLNSHILEECTEVKSRDFFEGSETSFAIAFGSIGAVVIGKMFA